MSNHTKFIKKVLELLDEVMDAQDGRCMDNETDKAKFYNAYQDKLEKEFKVNLDKPYSQEQKKAEKSGPGTNDAYLWCLYLLEKVLEHSEALDTESLPIDLHDEVARALILHRRRDKNGYKHGKHHE